MVIGRGSSNKLVALFLCVYTVLLFSMLAHKTEMKEISSVSAVFLLFHCFLCVRDTTPTTPAVVCVCVLSLNYILQHLPPIHLLTPSH